jgi:periplasmic copper chaperone A
MKNSYLEKLQTRFVRIAKAITGFSLLLAFTCLFSSQVWAHGTDAEQISQVMMAQFDKPSDRLSVEPVVIQSDFAVAGWIQSGRGGRALLRKEHGHWSIVVCGGDGLKSATALAQTGMSKVAAEGLSKALAVAEAKLNPDMLKKFAMFDGIVKVDAGHGAHGAGQVENHHPANVAAQTVDVKDAWVRTSVQGQKATGAFMTLTAKEGLTLIGGSSPVAGVTEIHEMKVDGGIMKMRAMAGGLALPAGQAVELKPGGYHVMLMDLKAPLAKDTAVALTLVFKDAKGAESKVEVSVPVARTAPGSKSHQMDKGSAAQLKQ